jgi:hypothetical protein
MSLTRVGLSCTLATDTTCTTLTFNDTTGTYNASTNPLGYGLPSGIASSDVTSINLTIRFESAGIYLTYLFTVSSNVITAATLSLNGATPVDITSKLLSTAFPIVSFNPLGSYGVILPTLEDGVYSTEYTISGTASATPFSYTTSQQIITDCNICCCNTKQFLNVDPNCEDFEDKLEDAMIVLGWIQVAKSNAEYGNINAAVSALNKAAELCDCGCGCGGDC